MPGYTKPANEVLTLTAGGKITFNGVYTEIIPPQVGTVEVSQHTRRGHLQHHRSGPLHWHGDRRANRDRHRCAGG